MPSYIVGAHPEDNPDLPGPSRLVHAESPAEAVKQFSELAPPPQGITFSVVEVDE
jgi:hypothetical protein